MHMHGFHIGIERCVHALEAGRCIVYPTEAVWGIGCDPRNSHALLELLRLKQRSPDKGLILISGSLSHFDFLLDSLSDDEKAKVLSTWPGHTTWLVPHRGRVNPLVSGNSLSTAIRVSAHPVVAALSRRFGGPIVSTSANPASLPSARTAIKARAYFKHQRLNFAPGKTLGEQRASRIIDLQSGKILRK